MPLSVSPQAATHVGRKRKRNEDSHLADPDLGLYIVADGMGGQAAGDVASRRAVDVARAYVADRVDVLTRFAANPSQENRVAAQELVASAIQAACADLWAMAENDPKLRGMGTTMVLFAVAGDRGVVGHVGDSRAYLLRQGVANRLTEDHTIVAASIKNGTMTKEQAKVSALRSVLTRAVGTQASVQVDTLLVEIMPGDLFLICSDGLYGYIEDEEVPALCAGVPDNLAEALVDVANERGGRDNITALVLSFHGATAEEPEPEALTKHEALRGIPLFMHLTYREQAEILAISDVRSHPIGAAIVTEGEPGEDLYVILRGRVAVEKDNVAITSIMTGGYFGEMGLVDDSRRSATVRALEPVRTMVITRTDMMNVMRREPVLAVKLLWSFVQGLSQRLRTVNTELSEARAELFEAQGVTPYTS
ncbi:cyclic nucleotide-binding domain-containing protein [Polyangium mundeleinium]|uniref:Cyclic nucleotide-binding domain-containing protein n=1 Tax=Polyangium mundeleinium TaxID=2995306 RepID=A0ABT5EP84_9BACT|nr:cyclic nucleotide-binding domain-containing protein [Polyangium mundeleinium]MDC0743644.1 cyclic nucleotide-binding domain-containing protein [Polyangium mundeleinium]